MHYLLMLAHAPDTWGEPADGTVGEPAVPVDGVTDDGVIDEWATYTRALHEAGVLVGGGALHGPESATTVQLRGGHRLLTDGPFSETKEHLIGFYVIDVPDLDAAVRWAARVPHIRTGTVEVRPVRPGSDTGTVLAARS